MNRCAGATHALLRIVSGFLFIHPGGMKILGWFGGMPAGVTLTPLLTAAGWIELVCGTLILIGFLTRPAAFLASGEMAFAYFIGHAPRSFFPVNNMGDAAILYCFVFLYLSAAGPGAWSLDGMRTKKPLP